MRLNVGCGEWPLPGFVNLDAVQLPARSYAKLNGAADILARVPPLPFGDGTLDEIYAGHFFEHLDPDEGGEFLDECRRALKPGGILGIVVPDFYAIARRYVKQVKSPVEFIRKEDGASVWKDTSDLDDMCQWFVYSTIQESPHKWCYDIDTLGRAIEGHGFTLDKEISRWFDPRITVGAWYQCGWQAVKEA